MVSLACGFSGKDSYRNISYGNGSAPGRSGQQAPRSHYGNIDRKGGPDSQAMVRISQA